MNGVPTTVLTNVTTVRDASGKIVNTYYSSNNVGDQLTSGSNLDGSKRSKTYIIKKSKNLPFDVKINQKVGNTNQRLFTLLLAVAKPPRVEKTCRFLGGLKRKPSSQNRAVSTGIQLKLHQVVKFILGLQSSSANERRFEEEHAYTVGGGAREGGYLSTTPVPPYVEPQTPRRRPTTTTTTTPQIDQANEARIRYEQRLQYEERQRQLEEQRRRLEEQQRSSKLRFLLTYSVMWKFG